MRLQLNALTLDLLPKRHFALQYFFMGDVHFALRYFLTGDAHFAVLGTLDLLPKRLQLLVG